jgi:hypothetical protein
VTATAKEQASLQPEQRDVVCRDAQLIEPRQRAVRGIRADLGGHQGRAAWTGIAQVHVPRARQAAEVVGDGGHPGGVPVYP